MGAKGKGKAGKASVRGSKKKMQKRSQQQQELRAFTKPGLRRLAKRGGIKRIGHGAVQEMRDYAHSFLQSVLRSTLALTEARKNNSERCTITAMDVIYALKRNGKTLYGFTV